jgi:tripartite-type tricarboxylate transporter receptor subunit TctC
MHAAARKLFVVAALSGASLASSTQAVAASGDYPNRPIRLLVPSPPGGSNDGVARVVAHEMSRSLGQSIVIDNRSGAGGTIAADLVARSTPNGYTVLFAYATFTTAPFLQANLPYDSLKDFAPVTEIANQPLLLAVNPAVPAKTVKELIALAKSRPGGLAAGYTQIGSATHLTTEIFKQRSDTVKNILGVSYKGGGPAQVALLSGEVQMSFTTVTSAMPQVKSGMIRVIATTAPERLPYLPNVPTFKESGVSGLEIAPWQGLMVPTGTPRAIINRLYSEVVQLLKLPDARKRLAALGSDPIGSSPEQFAAKIRREMQESEKIIKSIGLKPQ